MLPDAGLSVSPASSIARVALFTRSQQLFTR
jgi:hypothetical protein